MGYCRAFVLEISSLLSVSRLLEQHYTLLSDGKHNNTNNVTLVIFIIIVVINTIDRVILLKKISSYSYHNHRLSIDLPIAVELTADVLFYLVVFR